MSQDFVNGAKYKFSTVLSAPIPITAITNAAPPVITAGTMPTNDEIIILESGWSDLNDTATYSDTLGNLFELDTTDVSAFPPGLSAGSYRAASGWVSLSQITAIAQTGGDSNTFNWAYIDERSRKQRSKPTDKNPLELTFTMDRDPSLAWMDALDKMDKAQQLVVMVETLITGEQLIYTGFVSFNKSPTRTRNQNMQVTAKFSINSEVVAIPASFPSGS